MKTRNVAILMFDEVEVLDFAGPFEVFGVTGERNPGQPFLVFTVAEKPGPVLAVNQLSVNPTYTFANSPVPDIVIVPGGWGTRRQMNNPVVIDWLNSAAAQAELVLSVCTGSLVLAKAGLLDGLEATTHNGALDLLREVAPRSRIRANDRFVDNGKTITSAGISAGIDMSLHVVARLLGREVAVATAKYMEYAWNHAD